MNPSRATLRSQYPVRAAEQLFNQDAAKHPHVARLDIHWLAQQLFTSIAAHRFNMPNNKRIRNGRNANRQNSCGDAGCNGGCSSKHPEPPSTGQMNNISWNAFGTLAVLTNTIQSYYCCDSKAKLAYAEAEIQSRNVQILQMAETQRQLSECQNSALLAADVSLRQAKAELENAKRAHDAEKENWKKEKAALERRESRAKASLEKANAQLKEANAQLKAAGPRTSGAHGAAGQPASGNDPAGEMGNNDIYMRVKNPVVNGSWLTMACRAQMAVRTEPGRRSQKLRTVNLKHTS